MSFSEVGDWPLTLRSFWRILKIVCIIIIVFCGVVIRPLLFLLILCTVYGGHILVILFKHSAGLLLTCPPTAEEAQYMIIIFLLVIWRTVLYPWCSRQVTVFFHSASWSVFLSDLFDRFKSLTLIIIFVVLSLMASIWPCIRMTKRFECIITLCLSSHLSGCPCAFSLSAFN